MFSDIVLAAEYSLNLFLDTPIFKLAHLHIV